MFMKLLPRYISRYVKPFMICLLLLFVANITQAQPPDIGGDVDVPLDGGLSLLVAAGVGYGARKLKKQRTKQ